MLWRLARPVAMGWEHLAEWVRSKTCGLILLQKHRNAREHPRGNTAVLISSRFSYEQSTANQVLALAARIVNE